MIKIKQSGSFKHTEGFLRRMAQKDYLKIVEKYGPAGVAALASATPRDTGLTASSWVYEVRPSRGGVTIFWKNTNIVNGVPVAILIQYGHASKSGSYVQGKDYINPALRPIFDKIAEDIWKEVTAK
jgi:hypothetical protein